MKITGNTILITGGNSGIGRGLAQAFHQKGNQVIIVGRNEETLREVVAANEGMKYLQADVADAASTRELAQQVETQFPELNVLINNAGIMQAEDILKNPEGALEIAEKTIDINLLGPIRLTAHLLPLLQNQPHATWMTVTSGLAYVPLFLDPTYCATKAAIHSYTQTLRYQLKETNVEVMELVPPYVATSLQGDRQANDPNAMPLDEFIAEAMQLIETQPDASEITVERVKAQRFAGLSDNSTRKYDEVFTQFNDTMAKSRANWSE